MSLPLQHSPADVIRWLLVALGVGGDPTQSPLPLWPVYIDQEPSTPDNCITVYDTTPQYDGRDSPTGEVNQHYGFQIRVRGVDQPTTYVKSEAIRVALNEAVNQNLIAVGATTYLIPSIARTSLLRLGPDKANTRRHLATINGLAPIRVHGGAPPDGRVVYTKSGGYTSDANLTWDSTAEILTVGQVSIHGISGGGTVNFLRADGAWAAPPSTSPGGPVGAVQYNNAGAFAGAAGLTVDGSGNPLVPVGHPLTIRCGANVTTDGLHLIRDSDGAAVISVYQGPGLQANFDGYASVGFVGAGPVVISASLHADGGITRTGAPGNIIDLASSGPNATVTAQHATDVPFTIQLAASQSAAGLQVLPNGSSTPLLTIGPDGSVRAPSGTSSAPGLTFRAAPSCGFWLRDTGGYVQFVVPTFGAKVEFNPNEIQLHASYAIGWSNSAPGQVSSDIGLARNAAGVLRVTDGGAGLGSLLANNVTVPNNGFFWAIDNHGTALPVVGIDTANNFISRHLGPDGGAYYGTANAANTTGPVIIQVGAGIVIQCTPSGNNVLVTAQHPADVPLVVKGAASRTAPLLQLQTDAGASLGNPGGAIFDLLADASTTHTDGTEDTLASFTVAANTILRLGDGLEVEFLLQFVGHSTAQRQVRVYFAGSSFFDTNGITVTTGCGAVLRVVFMQTTAGIVAAIGTLIFHGNTYPPIVFRGVSSATLNAAAILKLTGIASGTGAAAGDITVHVGKVQTRPAA